VSRTTKSLLALLTAATLAAATAPAYADDDPPTGPTPACYGADGAPIFDADVCTDLGRQASGH
jgi:hypothetical protein